MNKRKNTARNTTQIERYEKKVRVTKYSVDMRVSRKETVNISVEVLEIAPPWKRQIENL